MVFVTPPKAPSRVTLAKPWVLLEHSLRRARFEHDFSHFDRVALGNVRLEVHMITAKAECSKREAARFKFFKCRGTRVDVGLLSKAVVPVLGHKHHRDPIVSRIFRLTGRLTAPAKKICHIHSSLGDAFGSPLDFFRFF